MAMKINKKPVPAKSIADWYAETYELQVTSNNRIQDAIDLRYRTREFLDECDIATKWEEHNNENKLKDRIAETEVYGSTLQVLMKKLDVEIERLQQERKTIEQQMVELCKRRDLVMNCITSRDERCGLELTDDDVSVQLDKECNITYEGIKTLEMKSQEAWERLNRLNLAKVNIQLEIKDKMEAMDIDKEQVVLTKAHALLSVKPDALRFPKNLHTQSHWRQHTALVIQRTQQEIILGSRTRENLMVARSTVGRLVEAQVAITDSAVRRRIHEMRRPINEIVHVKRMTEENMVKLDGELDKINESLAEKMNVIKLAETRLENRSYRPGLELCFDEADEGLRTEVRNGRRIAEMLKEKVQKTKIAYNILSQQSLKIDENLKDKEKALENNLHTLQMRERLANNA